MAYVEVDVENGKIKWFWATNKPAKRIEEFEELLNNLPIEVIPQNTITLDQMKLCYALFRQFGDEKGWTVGDTKEYFKETFSFAYEIGSFSLSPNKKDALTLEQATEFIQFIIEFSIQEDVNLYILDTKTRIKHHIREIVPDIQRYIIACLRKRVCCVCGQIHDFENGKIVDLEHFDNVNRIGGYEQDDGLQTRFLSLCRQHHMEIHAAPKDGFLEKYHLQAVYLNPQLVYELLDIYPNHFKLFRKRLKEGYYDKIIIRKKKNE